MIPNRHLKYFDKEIKEFRHNGYPNVRSVVSFKPSYEEYHIVVTPEHDYANPGTWKIIMANTDDGTIGWHQVDDFTMLYGMALFEHSDGIVHYKQDFERFRFGCVGGDAFWFGSTLRNKRMTRCLWIKHDKGILVPESIIQQ
jgi:hypothetical protein